MKNFALKHPIVTSLLVFLSIIVSVIVFIIAYSNLLTGNCQPTNSEPCDGVGLVIVALWSLLVPASLFLGIVGGSITFVVLSWKKEKLEELK